MKNNNKTLAKASKHLILKEPFYGLFLLKLNKEWVEGIGTAGVSIKGVNVSLSIDPDFWSMLPFEHKVGLLKHELIHIAYSHLFLRNTFADKKVFNIAADLVVNQLIDRDYLIGGAYPSLQSYLDDLEIIKDGIDSALDSGLITEEVAIQKKARLPLRGIFLEDYDGFPPNESTKFYYDLLMEEIDSDGKSENQVIQDALDGDDHNWEMEDLDPITEKLIRKQIEHSMKETAEQVIKSRGTVPGELETIIKDLYKVEAPKFDWKGYLRNFVGGSTQTEVRKTRRKRSIRFEDDAGLKVISKLSVMIAIDTSASFNDEEMIECWGELNHICKMGAEMTVVQADTRIQKITKYTPTKGGIKIFGRGGTDFTEAVDYYNDNLSKFSCLIYFTDGECANPERNPKGRVLWVLSSQSDMNNKLPGKVIKLN